MSRCPLPGGLPSPRSVIAGSEVPSAAVRCALEPAHQRDVMPFEGMRPIRRSRRPWARRRRARSRAGGARKSRFSWWQVAARAQARVNEGMGGIRREDRALTKPSAAFSAKTEPVLDAPRRQAREAGQSRMARERLGRIAPPDRSASSCSRRPTRTRPQRADNASCKHPKRRLRLSASGNCRPAKGSRSAESRRSG